MSPGDAHATGPSDEDAAHGHAGHASPEGAALVASVVIPALNAAATIGTQLDALASQDADVPWEVIVVDNGSTDDTVAVCRGYAERIPCLRIVTCGRPGTGAARNAGVAAAKADKLLFCDADDEVDAGWVRAMIAALDRSDAAGGAIDNDRLNDYTSAPWLPRHPEGLPVAAGFLPRALTANLAVRRRVFDDVGGFSVDYTYGSDDVEFSWRLQLASYELAYAPDAVVHYRHRFTLKGTAVKAFRSGHGRARLFRDYHRRGMPRPRLAGAALRWARLVMVLPALPWSPRWRWWWVEQAGGAAGRIAGSLHFRVRYL